MKELEKTAQKYAILDHVQVGMCLVRDDFTVLFWNRCLEVWSGIERSDILGTDLCKHFPHLGELSYQRRIDSVFRGGAPVIFSSHLHKYIFPTLLANGEPRIQHTIVTAVPSIDENTHYALFSVEDVTDLTQRIAEHRKAREELRKTNAEKDKFFSIIAHDLRSPINSLLSFIQLMEDEIEQLSEDDIVELTCDLKKNVENTYRLLENLLEWSRSQTGRIVFKPESIMLNDVLESTITLVKESAINKKISIESEIVPELKVNVDKNMISTVFRNLLTNAIKFTPREGRVNVKAEKRNGSVTVSVSDTGVGMSEDKMQKLFRIDTKITSIGTNNEKGSGLGLILCKEFVERHNGRIEIESEQGKGSTFSIMLPA